MSAQTIADALRAEVAELRRELREAYEGIAASEKGLEAELATAHAHLAHALSGCYQYRCAACEMARLWLEMSERDAETAAVDALMDAFNPPARWEAKSALNTLRALGWHPIELCPTALQVGAANTRAERAQIERGGTPE